MKSLRPIWRELSILFYRRALAEIDPMHRDVPVIVLTLHALHNERKAAR